MSSDNYLINISTVISKPRTDFFNRKILKICCHFTTNLKLTFFRSHTHRRSFAKCSGGEDDKSYQRLLKIKELFCLTGLIFFLMVTRPFYLFLTAAIILSTRTYMYIQAYYLPVIQQLILQLNWLRAL